MSNKENEQNDWRMSQMKFTTVYNYFVILTKFCYFRNF